MSEGLPNLVTGLRPVMDSLPPAAQPGFMAGLERQAAGNYRQWAEAADDSVLAIGLRLCAAREDSVADIIETTFPSDPSHAAPLQEAAAQLQAAGDPFAGYEPAECMRMQAAAERNGAAAWRQIAMGIDDAASRRALEICAHLEEQSADFLESWLGSGL